MACKSKSDFLKISLGSFGSIIQLRGDVSESETPPISAKIMRPAEAYSAAFWALLGSFVDIRLRIFLPTLLHVCTITDRPTFSVAISKEEWPRGVKLEINTPAEGISAKVRMKRGMQKNNTISRITSNRS